MVNLTSRVAVVAAGLVIAGGVAISPAFAAPATGPGSAECLTAQATVKIRVDAAAAASISFENAAGKLDAATKATIAAAIDKFDAAKAELDTALAALKAAPTDANAAAAKKAGEKLVAAATILLAIPGLEPVADAKQALINARAALEAALTVQDKACDGPTPTVTPTPSPTATPPLYADCDAVRDAGKAPLHRSQPGYRNALDSDGDGFACENVEGTVPVPDDDNGPPPASINTGRA